MDGERTDRQSGEIRYRKLRIAWSVGWGIVFAMTVILWWRSYQFYDSLVYNVSSKALETCWCNGLLHVGYMKEPVVGDVGPLIVQTHAITRMKRWLEEIPQKRANALGFGGINTNFEVVVIMPFWFPMVISGVCSALPWPMRIQRFQIRTLLFATTIVGIVLGLAAYAARK